MLTEVSLVFFGVSARILKSKKVKSGGIKRKKSSVRQKRKRETKNAMYKVYVTLLETVSLAQMLERDESNVGYSCATVNIEKGIDERERRKGLKDKG